MLRMSCWRRLFSSWICLLVMVGMEFQRMKDLMGEAGSGGYFPFFVLEGGVSVFDEVSAFVEDEELSALAADEELSALAADEDPSTFTEDEDPSTFTEDELASSMGGGEALFCSFKFYA